MEYIDKPADNTHSRGVKAVDDRSFFDDSKDDGALRRDVFFKVQMGKILFRFQDHLLSPLFQRHGLLKLCQGDGTVQKRRGEVGIVGTIAYDDIVVLIGGQEGADKILLAPGSNIGAEINLRFMRRIEIQCRML